MTTINMFSESGVEEVAIRSSLSGFEFEEADDELCTRMRPVIDDDAVAELVHDIRNTIGAVAMLSELTALELPQNSHLREMTGNVQRACHDAGDQCEQILAALRGSPAQPEPTDLSALIQGMAPLMATWMPPASVLRFSLESDLPPLELTPDEIRRMVMNLVKNAAEAVTAHPGVVTVSTGWIELDGAGQSHCDRRAYLAVSDTGCGMDEPTRAGLQSGHFTSKSNGHGLGLASVRRIVAAHGAHLRITSRVDAGTTIHVVFGEQFPVAADVPLRIHDACEPSVVLDDIRVLSLRQNAASVDRHSAPVSTPGPRRLRLCETESMAFESQR